VAPQDSKWGGAQRSFERWWPAGGSGRRRRGAPHGRVPIQNRGKGGDDRWAPATVRAAVNRYSNRFEPIQTVSKISKPNKLQLIQKGPSRAQKIDVKYGVEGFEERNDFLHRNFLKFKVDFE
jgi:hypothetical protein